MINPFLRFSVLRDPVQGRTYLGCYICTWNNWISPEASVLLCNNVQFWYFFSLFPLFVYWNIVIWKISMMIESNFFRCCGAKTLFNRENLLGEATFYMKLVDLTETLPNSYFLCSLFFYFILTRCMIVFCSCDQL